MLYSNLPVRMGGAWRRRCPGGGAGADRRGFPRWRGRAAAMAGGSYIGSAWIRSEHAASVTAACFDPAGLLRWRVGSSSPLLLAGGVGATSLVPMKVLVLGFVSRQDKDLLVACLH